MLPVFAPDGSLFLPFYYLSLFYAAFCQKHFPTLLFE
jgi:hypothetical protein